MSAHPLSARRAAVTVERNGVDLVIAPGSIGVLKLGALVTEVPNYLRVVSADGDVIRPSNGKRFYITTETFDPLHCVAEL